MTFNEKVIKQGFDGQIKVNDAQKDFNHSQQDFNNAVHKALEVIETRYKQLDQYSDKLRKGMICLLGINFVMLLILIYEVSKWK